MTRSGGILERLRLETRAAHMRLEHSVRLDERLASPERYRALLARYYGLYRPLEEVLATRLCGKADWSARRKLPALERDLVCLGLDRVALARLPRCGSLPAFEEEAEAWGALYVLEGATLGGRLIAGRLAALDVGPNDGGGFFAVYGARVGPMWQAFRSQLSAYVDAHDGPEAADAVVRGAKLTFELFERWLVDAPTRDTLYASAGANDG